MAGSRPPRYLIELIAIYLIKLSNYDQFIFLGRLWDHKAKHSKVAAKQRLVYFENCIFIVTCLLNGLPWNRML